MRVAIRVTPRAKRPAVIPAPDGTLRVKVAAPAQDGRANADAVKALAAHFNVPQRAVSIVQGHTSRSKIVEITTTISHQVT